MTLPCFRWTRLVALLLLTACLAACGGQGDISPRELRESKRIALLTTLKEHPKNVGAQVELARVLFALGDGLGAETALDAARAAGGLEEELRPLFAKAVAMQGDSDRALAIMDGGPIASDMNGEAAWIEGSIYLDRGDLNSARNALDIAVKAMPRKSGLWVDVARFRNANAEALGARDAIDFAIELDKGNSRALAFKANLVRTQAGLRASLPWYEAALAADPDNVSALIDRAATLGDLGRYKDMLVAVRHAAELAPRDPRPYFLQAVLAARADNYLLARSLLQRTRGMLDNQPSFLLVSAIVELKLGGEAVAADLSQKLLDQQPNNMTARRLLAVANWASGDPDGAEDALAPLVVRADADSWSLQLAARVAAELGKPEVAASFLGRGASLQRGEAEPFTADNRYGQLESNANLNPLDPSVVIPAIAAEMAGGQTRLALARAEKLRAVNRGVAEAQLLVGDAAMAAGDMTTAILAYRAARDLDASERTTLRLANAQRRAGDVAGSGATILTLRDSEPSSIAADRLAGHLAMDLEHWDNAISHFERVRERIGNRDVVVLCELSLAWSAKGDDARALQFIALAYRLQPLNAGIMNIYANFLAKKGNIQAAGDLRNKAAEIGR